MKTNVYKTLTRRGFIGRVATLLGVGAIMPSVLGESVAPHVSKWAVPPEIVYTGPTTIIKTANNGQAISVNGFLLTHPSQRLLCDVRNGRIIPRELIIK